MTFSGCKSSFNFEKEKNYILCSAERGFNNQTGSFYLESYWSTLHDEIVNCSNDYSEFERTKKLIELDKACLERFFNEAPQEEWTNLIRLNELSSRRTLSADK